MILDQVLILFGLFIAFYHTRECEYSIWWSTRSMNKSCANGSCNESKMFYSSHWVQGYFICWKRTCRTIFMVIVVQLWIYKTTKLNRAKVTCDMPTIFYTFLWTQGYFICKFWMCRSSDMNFTRRGQILFVLNLNRKTGEGVRRRGAFLLVITAWRGSASGSAY